MAELVGAVTKITKGFLEINAISIGTIYYRAGHATIVQLRDDDNATTLKNFSERKYTKNIKVSVSKWISYTTNKEIKQ